MKYLCFFVLIITIFAIILSFNQCEGLNKYSAEANKPKKAPKSNEDSSPPILVPSSLKDLDKPFRMAKLNLLWNKAKHRLSEPKLKSLFSDLKLHDKEEIAFKHRSTDGKADDDGLMEAKLRKKLIGIMSSFGLLDHFSMTDDPEELKHHKPLNDGRNYVSKDVFTDKRLNQLWSKAENAGFTAEELEALKEEFTHHQEKVDEYMSLLKKIDTDPKAYENSLKDDHIEWNEIDHKETVDKSFEKKSGEPHHVAKANLLKTKFRDINTGYDELDRKTAQGPRHQEFVEPKVQGLWRMAKDAQFSKEELNSLKKELHHYEARLLKLRHMHTEAALNKNDVNNSNYDSQSIKKHTRTVEKLHADIESRIAQRHTEL